MPKLRLCLALHNHQPVGNFDGVIEAAYRDSYFPFLEVIEKYPTIPFSLHTSGCLMEWLVEHHPEYIDRLRALVERGQAEIVGGAYYEPILPMIPSRDRLGQIRGYTEYLLELFGAPIRGMWIAERVWEQSLVADIARAGIQYTLIDDYHFRKAGLEADAMFGDYWTEDDGRVLRVVPGSEPMRYLIPFQEPDAMIHYLREVQDKHPGALVVFADDGEKFGTWPDTKAHVYEHGWIYRFLDALQANADWISVRTVADALDQAEPVGHIYLSDCSYREMTEWALPADRLAHFEHLWHDLDHSESGKRIQEFIKGGFWRNFKVKYPETREMYARMMFVSGWLDRLCREDTEAFGDHTLFLARRELYRGQCNCPYWHGAFGGLYLPHLRNAIYRHLIEAENHLVTYTRGPGARFAQASTRDFLFEGRPSVRLENDRMIGYLTPAGGGQLFELDVRSIGVNLGATVARRFEAYHEKIRNAGENANASFGSIHDRVVFKQPGLDRHLVVDSQPRRSFVDRFLAPGTGPESFEKATVTDLGDFSRERYEHTLSRTDARVVLAMSRAGHIEVEGVSHPLRIQKTVVLEPGSRELVVDYLLESLPGVPLHFGVELNLAALPAGADDRYFLDGNGHRLGQLQSMLDLHGARSLSLVDEWQGIEVGIHVSRAAGFWTCPIATVSQSEGGFELVHQNVCVVPHWHIPADLDHFAVSIRLMLDTSRAEARQSAEEAESLEASRA